MKKENMFLGEESRKVMSELAYKCGFGIYKVCKEKCMFNQICGRNPRNMASRKSFVKNGLIGDEEKHQKRGK